MTTSAESIPLRNQHTPVDPISRILGAFWGMWIGDALAMPAHYYRDKDVIKHHYGLLNEYKAPHSIHPGSRMTRQTYAPFSSKADVVHEVKEAWSKPGTHVHKSLRPGDSTLNLKLARCLFESMQQHGSYNEGDYIQRYLNLMLTPGAHGDTWVDESHQTFFNHYAQGKPITGCGDEDQTLSGVVISLPILIHGWRDPHTASLKADDLTDIAHKGRKVAGTTRLLAHIFSWIFKNHDIDTILHKKTGKGAHSCLNYPFKDWISKDDFEVIGQLVHPGDQLDDNMPTLMYLALKYQNDPGQALLVNAHSGGDSCHRGAILGALLGALNGVESLPADWVFGLNEYDSLDKISDWLIELQ
ncbi:MAG: ADP-ribosylglycohydrolase family protein [Verrucomicrobiota bacterium]